MSDSPPLPDGLSEALIDRFHQDGVIVLRQLIDTSWRRRLEAMIERDLEKPGPFFHNFRANTGKYHATSRLWNHDADARAYVFESPLPEMAAALMRSQKVNLLYDQIFVKEPNSDAPSPWHQDQVVWPIKGKQVMSFWLALDPVTKESGRLDYIRGSHRWGKQFQPITMGGRVYERNPDYEPMPDISATRDQYDFVSEDMEPGDVLCFHALTVHGGGGNETSDRRRRAYSVRYTGDDIVYDRRSSTMTELENPGLASGDPLDTPLFPVVWPR